jgi:hypothetical protein
MTNETPDRLSGDMIMALEDRAGWASKYVRVKPEVLRALINEVRLARRSAIDQARPLPEGADIKAAYKREALDEVTAAMNDADRHESISAVIPIAPLKRILAALNPIAPKGGDWVPHGLSHIDENGHFVHVKVSAQPAPIVDRERLVKLISEDSAYQAEVMDEQQVWLAGILADEIIRIIQGKT